MPRDFEIYFWSPLNFQLNLIQFMKIKLIAVLLAFLALSGCHTFKQTNFDNFQYEKLPVKGSKSEKEGRACEEFTLWENNIFHSNVDLTIDTAKKNGDIVDIISVERESTYAPFYRKICTIVKGN